MTRPHLRRTALFALLLIASADTAAGQAPAQQRSWFSNTFGGSTPGGSAANPGASLVAPDGGVPRPPAPIGNPPAVAPPDAGAQPAAPTPISPAARPPAAAPGRPAQAVVPPAMSGIAVSARLGPQQPPIVSGLHWRVYADKPDTGGQFRMIKEDKAANPFFVLPPGGYIVHVALGLASAAKRVQVRADAVREVFDLPVGGLRFEGRVGDTRIPNGQISFDIYGGSQFEAGDKRPIASDIPTGDLVLVPEGIYHVVSNYGDGNAVMRYDLRVQAGKVTDTRINHRAAVITLKLVGEKGGEALANTAWSVLTPGGDVIKESIGAFPTFVLAEGEYVVLARNGGKVYNREFKVETGFDREIELVAR